VLRARGVSRSSARSERGALDIRAALERTENSLARLEADQRRWRTNRDRHADEVRRLDGELAEARSALGELEGRIAAAADRLREIGAQERATSLTRDLAEQDRDERTRRAEAAALDRRSLDERRTTLRTEETEVRRELESTERELASLEEIARAAAERK